jgi:putative colanic acid biosysnthesis UDP-glucose lipid carrier transferase
MQQEFHGQERISFWDNQSISGSFYHDNGPYSIRHFLRIEKIQSPPNGHTVIVKKIPLTFSANRFIKRSCDLFATTMVIVLLLSWLIPLLALLIKIDSKGPVFFLQKRQKKDGRVFRCLKFRTMFANNYADILPSDDDKRITRIGRFLRLHHIDELPQFFNVLVGDMSVIGPRPLMIHENIKYERLVSWYSLRHKVKPGITGLAQVMGYSGSTTNLDKMKSRVYLDIIYMKNWSLLLDIKIMLKTGKKLLGL